MGKYKEARKFMKDQIARMMQSQEGPKHYQVREGSKIIAIRETIEEADKIVNDLSFTGKTYVVVQVNEELKFRNKNKEKTNE